MNWPSYLIQMNIYLILFYAFYMLVLQNETFFKWNRIYLVGSGTLSFILPLIQSEWVRAMFVTKQVEQVKQVIAISPGMALNEIQVTPAVTHNLSTTQWIALIYFGGVIIYLVKFLWQLFNLSRSFKNGYQAKSFFGIIVVSENLPSRESILKHEKVHAAQLHSADVIFFEIMSLICWFNPVVYAYKRAVRYIHEFIADEVASEEKGKSDYALLLVSNVFGIRQEQLSNNFFNHSLLKKRIMMLNKTKSRKTALLKYGLAVPLFAAMIVFSSATTREQKISTLKSIPIIKTISASLPAPIVKSISETAEMIPKINPVSSLFEDTTKSNSNEQFDKLFKEVEESLRRTALAQSSSNQAEPIRADSSAVYDVASIEVMPEYPGGIGRFYEWLGKNYKYPSAAQNAGVSGKIYISFVVEKDGSLSKIKILKDLGYGTGEAAVKMLKTCINWKPGIQNGKPVRVQYTLPIALQIEKKSPADSVRIRQGSSLFKPGNNPLIIIDGKRLEKEIPAEFNVATADEKAYADLLYIKLADIYSISIVKDQSAIAQYGEKAKNGALIITTKASRMATSIHGSSDKPSETRVQNIWAKTPENIVYLLDGKEMNPEGRKNINPDDIEHISVVKEGKELEKYGPKAKNGIIRITTKKSSKTGQQN